MTKPRTHIVRALVCAAVIASSAVGAAQRGVEGTAEISGTVTTTNVPAAPLARVLVTISGPSIPASRTTITGDDGRFAFRNLPGGSFTIVAARPPYVRTAFGAKRPARPGTPVNLTAGQRMTGVTIQLARGAAITGIIRDPSGEPVRGVKVEVTPLDTQASPLSAPVVTDDRGVYRAFGLPPGMYVVTAGVTDDGIWTLTQFSDAEMDKTLASLLRRSASGAAPGGTTAAAGARGAGPAGPDPNRRPATYGYAPIHYPGTADPEQAVALALAEGEERAGVDIGLQLVRTVAIEGRVTIAGGALPTATQITIARERPPGGSASTLASPGITRQPNAAGDFRFTGILPGKYRIVARATTTAPAGNAVSGVYWALTSVAIADDVSGVPLMLQPGLRLSGRITFDAHTQTPPKDLSTVRLRLVEVAGATPLLPLGSGRADGTFEISGILPGTYRITSLLPDTAWSLRSVVVDGRDVLDFPIELGPAGDVSGAVVTFTDQQAELSGTLQSAANVPAPEYFVVVFPADRAFWRPASRRVRSTRPGTDGRFTLRDLPAGDYLVAALTDLEPSDLADPSFMERLIPAALSVRLNEGEKKTQDLRLVR